MNKKPKKLSLSKETLRSLDQSDFSHVAGGATAFQTNCGTCTTPSYCRRCQPTPSLLSMCLTVCGCTEETDFCQE
jgi:natural product precursor